MANYEDIRCWDCCKDRNEWYGVKKQIWLMAMRNGGRADFLCIGCLEKRIGTKLNWWDFDNSWLLNILPYYPRSKRLTSRMSRPGIQIWKAIIQSVKRIHKTANWRSKFRSIARREVQNLRQHYIDIPEETLFNALETEAYYDDMQKLENGGYVDV